MVKTSAGASCLNFILNLNFYKYILGMAGQKKNIEISRLNSILT